VNLSRLKEGISLFNGYFVLNALKWGIFFTAKAGVEVFLDNFKNVGSIQLFKDIFTVF